MLSKHNRKTTKTQYSVLIFVLLAIGYYYHLDYLRLQLKTLEDDCMNNMPLNVDMDLATGVCDGKTISKIGAVTKKQIKILQIFKQIHWLY